MAEYTIKTPEQLGSMLRGFRRERKLSQQEVGTKAAFPQPVISKIEANSGKVTLSRLLKVLAVLDLELVVRPRGQAKRLREW